MINLINLILIKAILLFFVAAYEAVPVKQGLEKNVPFEDKSFKQYKQDLMAHYNNRNYFAAIYGNEKTRRDFTKFLNEGLTQQAKDDLSGLRFYKKVGDAEVPMVMFGPQMDSWLGILPQWKRTKRYMFKKIEEYLSLHPELLQNQPEVQKNNADNEKP